jgi:hypothetical protein
MIIFSLSTIPEREKNLSHILPNIIEQCDILYVNLIDYKNIPKILIDKKIIINRFKDKGSEIRFFDFNDVPEGSYFFTIDDDILYPKDYANRMIENMSKYDNNVVCCVHGSNIDKSMNKDFYKKNRKVYHFKEELYENTEVMIPGVGTSCFFTGKVKIDISKYVTKNMSDAYTACFLSEQNIRRISIERSKNWLIPLEDFGRKIFGNNPHQEIDSMIAKYKDIL